MQKGIIMNLQFKPVEAKDIERVTPFTAKRLPFSVYEYFTFSK